MYLSTTNNIVNFKSGRRKIVWNVINHDEEIEATFADPWKAAAFCIEHRCAIVEMQAVHPDSQTDD